MRIRKLRLVKPGVQANGQTVTKQHLEQVVKNYKDDARPPITFGHPGKGADKTPAFGRACKPELDNDGALVLNLNYTPELEAREDKGEFEGFSGGIHPHPDTGEYYLHHVAACGQLPPAADTKTLEVVELSATGDNIIYLSSEIIKEDITMDPDELKKLLEDALKPVIERIETLEGKDKKTNDNDNPSDTEQPQSKELSALLETVKADRIKTIKATANSKGLSEEQIKPLVERLESTEALELADNKPNSAYNSTLAFINGLKEPEPNVDLLNPLELSDSKGETKPLDSAELANKL
ncbi:hypothetical protein [Pseudoalteromonas luteoviolacea]|uniref:hypothetical protein n=1 Tax=Pseudoalteromonas luteoviolacea TaxID=43657 RepID=UPI00114EE0F2|nr:hypothetical protein [Pseudoalteromonas luteoviolacea]TQF71790.1 hypothetical protein FLM44_12205 [Pseudoalteromonas luteoviolacea]